MSHGYGKYGAWGFASVRDWFESIILSFPRPWTVAPLSGKYYGTDIIDAHGTPILSFWEIEETSIPSKREKEQFGDDWSEEAWADYCCDCHWESDASLAFAEYVVGAVNNGYVQDNDDLALLILLRACWSDEVFEDIACGGRDRRSPRPDPETARMIGWKDRSRKTISADSPPSLL